MTKRGTMSLEAATTFFLFKSPGDGHKSFQFSINKNRNFVIYRERLHLPTSRCSNTAKINTNIWNNPSKMGLTAKNIQKWSRRCRIMVKHTFPASPGSNNFIISYLSIGKSDNQSRITWQCRKMNLTMDKKPIKLTDLVSCEFTGIQWEPCSTGVPSFPNRWEATSEWNLYVHQFHPRLQKHP